VALGDRHEPVDSSRARFDEFAREVGTAFIVDRRRTAYPLLRRAISAYLRDVSDYVHMDQPDAARSALQMALAIRSEIELAPEDRR
jgi:hypothetical protein